MVISPLRVKKRDEEELASNAVFCALRKQLSGNMMLRFCPVHEPSIQTDEKRVFELHRDILHAVFMPLKQLVLHATDVASRSLPGCLALDPERAFHGEARNAFAWLRSIITDEPDWCTTNGCPACVVLHIFHSEPLIRIVSVACRVSNWMSHVGLMEQGMRLPNFNFWLTALAKAVISDYFWGYDYWMETYDRSVYMDLSTRKLVYQCFEIRDAGYKISHRPPDYDPGTTLDGRPRIHVEDSPQPLFLPEENIEQEKWEELVLMAKKNKSRSHLLPRTGGQGFSPRKHGRNTAVAV
ncbi:hypothetical protein MGYG_08031 [Nannizzia gypsea CBS 118893]|uniref:Uncharacterized protein n=1 Tax=Arthroderma gypseum (strain ATCC MYA-4604 / CBS 118893) TaxID=535722 RepID=E4V4V2_ARTGP|nr:hypothetical protein MGYG_08031 [Nannizzia gypsea CBS 118893]EFR05026.1 hypothetical protein MGYG_08031 [Nannizzia gypsea CBS 118893]